MTVFELLRQLQFQPSNAIVRVDVGGDVRNITHITVLHDGEDIVLIVPKES